MQNIRNFCIIAHINHGKSTLADRFLELTGTVEKRKMHEQFLDAMDLERERGITIKLQPVRMHYTLNAVRYTLNLIDTPGHVDFSYEVSRSLAAVEGAILLVDAAKGVQAQTLANLHLARKQGLVIIPVINKIDLASARVAEVEEEVKNLLLSFYHDRSVVIAPDFEVLKISAKTGEGVGKVLEAVIERIPPPAESWEPGVPISACGNRGSAIRQRIGTESGASRALIFDSAFDTYKGIIAYVRVFDGKFRTGDKIKLFASKAGGEIIEVGYFLPQLKRTDEISAGEIGYIATGLKDPSQVRVGDTVTSAISNKQQAISPLAGYQEPRPVVFASFYPENSDDYDTLKDALAKLKLTDASLSYEPESSPALGRGFRLGFLGMLHAEIVSERLRREFKLSLVISTPSVEYKVKVKNQPARLNDVSRSGGKAKGKNDELTIRAAALLPDAGIIEKIEEPVVQLEILSPASGLGPVMKLVAETRSRYLTTDYLTKEVVILRYRAPLAEIVTDFYDRLKSISSGYASMNYEPAGYEAADLVRLDILIAGELVEPFSKIVPRESAYQEGKRTVEKLKEIVPHQLFAVSLQAAIGGKIIARETIGALRKDVTGYLYGGDVTRKKKLLEKQKRGKTKLKERGRVEIPQKVFLEMLRR